MPVYSNDMMRHREVCDLVVSLPEVISYRTEDPALSSLLLITNLKSEE